ncbi:MAG: DUF1559 domain-containing protein [Planctomycetota bacterium]
MSTVSGQFGGTSSTGTRERTYHFDESQTHFSTSGPHSGLTLIEVLVSIAMIGGLVAMMLPSLQLARESSRSIRCLNNLKQLSLGVLNYESRARELPPAVSPSPRHTWIAFILPYLEHSATYDSLDWSTDWDSESNRSAVRQSINVLGCSSTPIPANRLAPIETAGQGPDLPEVGSDSALCAITDYATPSFVARILIGQQYIPPTEDVRGALDRMKATPLRRIKDGTSKTLLVVESAGRPEHWTARGKGPQESFPGGGNYSVQGGHVKGAGWSDPKSITPLHGFQPNGLSCPGPCAINCTNNNEAFSFHPQIVNVAYADGHSTRLNENTDIKVYASLITRNGGETTH